MRSFEGDSITLLLRGIKIMVVPLSFCLMFCSTVVLLQKYHSDIQEASNAIFAYVLGAFNLLLILSICT